MFKRNETNYFKYDIYSPPINIKMLHTISSPPPPPDNSKMNTESPFGALSETRFHGLSLHIIFSGYLFLN